MSVPTEHTLRLAVIGGGLTGAALVIHAVRAAAGPLILDVIEPAAEIGRGIAYGTVDPAQRINVPSDKMSLVPEDPDHLTRWLFDRGILPDPASTDANGHHYVPRGAYGDYVADTLRRTLADAGSRVRLRHVRARAAAIHAETAGWIVQLSDGRQIAADQVMLCCGHAPPSPPSTVSPDALKHPGFVPNPWARDAFAGIGPRDSVLVVGTGLTMADVVASLDRLGHQGSIAAISRRGLLALPHGLFLADVDFVDREALPTTALALLRLARRRVRDLGPRIGWQPLMDALRFDLRRVWTALPPREQRRAVRRLLPFWEVHRFRIAPQIHDLLRDARRQGRLSVETAAFEALGVREGRLVAEIRPRRGVREARSYDHVVLCTGPGPRLTADPLVTAILDRGLGGPDAVGLGLAVDEESRILAPDGTPRADLRALGPITRGSFGEMTGAPDIIRHVARLAADIVRQTALVEPAGQRFAF